MVPKLVIGLTGLPGAGKGEFIEAVSKYAEKRGVMLRRYSLSDALRLEARRRGEPVERPVLHRIGNELRATFGNGALARLICSEIEIDHISDISEIIVVDSIRHPDEVKELAERFGASFHMIAVIAPVETLMARIASRARSDESQEALSSRTAAEGLMKAEMGGGEPSYGLNIRATIEASEVVIVNDTTLDRLKGVAWSLLDDFYAKSADVT